MVTSGDIAVGLQHARGDPLSAAQIVEVLKDAATATLDVSIAVTDIMGGELDPVLIANAAIKLLKAYNAIADGVNVVTGGQTLPPVPLGAAKKRGDPPVLRVTAAPINPFDKSGELASFAAAMACWGNQLRPIPTEIPDSITPLNFSFTVPYAACFGINPDTPIDPPVEDALLKVATAAQKVPQEAALSLSSAFAGLARALGL